MGQRSRAGGGGEGTDELLIFQADQSLILLLNYFSFNFVMWNLVPVKRKDLRAVKESGLSPQVTRTAGGRSS